MAQLTRELTKHPDSHVRASVEGWAHPWTWEAWVLANIFDQWSGKNAKPYPRPNDRAPVRLGVPGVDQARVMAALMARGHGSEN